MSRILGGGRTRPFMAASLAVAFTAAGCGDDSRPTNTAERADGFDGISELDQPLTALMNSQCVWVDTVGTPGQLTITLAQDETAIISAKADNSIVVNGVKCSDVSAAVITKTTLKTLIVNGNAMGDETVILDYLNGTFGLGSATAANGTTIALGAQAMMGTGDSLKVRMTKMADNVTAGSDTKFNLNGDAYADIKSISGVENYVFSLGPGADTFRASGVAGQTSPVGAMPFATAVKVYGGPDADILCGGAGNDTLYGDEGNDTFEGEATAAGGNDAFNGGAGTGDVVTYAARAATHGLVVTIDGMANDGENTDDMDDDAEETDNIATDIENVTGGPGADVLTGSSSANTISGGAGADTLNGSSGDDILNGDDGNDTFNEEADANGADTLNGGAGSDTVDYSGRSVSVLVTIGVDTDRDGKDLGTVGTSDMLDEGDKVTATVENVLGGSGADKITGSAMDNVLTGNGGADTLDGAAGDDTFDESTDTTGAGADIIKGGAGFDTVTYAMRMTAVTFAAEATMGMDIGLRIVTNTLGNDKIDNAVEHIIGTSAADVIYGSSSDDQLEGLGGDDTLHGGDGEDLIEGGAGDDTINCGAGSDITIPGADQMMGVINVDCEL